MVLELFVVLVHNVVVQSELLPLEHICRSVVAIYLCIVFWHLGLQNQNHKDFNMIFNCEI